MALKIGSRRSELGSFILPPNTPHHGWMFEVLFSSDDDEVIADALYAWVMDPYRTRVVGPHQPRRTTIGLCARDLAGRVERGAPFSPRLQRTIVHVIECVWFGDSEVAGLELETARLLNHLDLRVGGMKYKNIWYQLIIDVIRSPTGREGLPTYCWHILGTLSLTMPVFSYDIGVMRSLVDAEDWEKLEVWTLVVWHSTPPWSEERLEDIGQMTLKLFQRLPSAISTFESLYKGGTKSTKRDKILRICNRARVNGLPLVSPSL